MYLADSLQQGSTVDHVLRTEKVPEFTEAMLVAVVMVLSVIKYLFQHLLNLRKPDTVEK